MTEKITVTILQASEMTGLSRSSIYKIMGEGKLPSLKLCGRTLIRVSDIHALVDSLAPQSEAA